MYAMQYQVTLPSDYDMGIIRARVRTTDHLMDGFAGLEVKAYLIQEKAQGAPHNAYAPFYVWRDIDGMRRFCWSDPGYSSIVRDFGRQPIQDLTVHAYIDGPASSAAARSLSVRTVALPAGVAPSQCLDDVTAEFLAGGSATTVARVTAVDVTTWTVALVELSAELPDQTATDATVYEVLHLSHGVSAGSSSPRAAAGAPY